MIFFLTFASDEERDKFEYLYNKYKNLLFYNAQGILRDHMLTEDAVSEAYLRIYKNLHKIDDVDSPRTVSFIVTIARNAALTMVTKNKNESYDLINDDEPDDFDVELNVISEIASSDIYSIVGGLDEDLRNIFVLKFAYDMSNKEIADIFETTDNNIRVKLCRAKKKLAVILTKEGYVDGK